MSASNLESLGQHQRELLAGKVLGDLTDGEQAEVSQLLENESFRDELFELERSAAALELAAGGNAESNLPEALQLRLQAEAESYFRSQEMAQSGDGPTAFATPTAKPHNRREWLAWACCAAAVLLCVGLVLPRPETRLNVSLARAELLKSSSDVVQVNWASGTTPFANPVSGDVVWSNEKQLGYMLFEGMPINDPTVEQYQLWIIDPGRDDEPIDGGVFDVTESGQVVVPIQAKLGVVDPKAFAITVEKPGGVVVSTQERLPLLAPVE